jgi:vancomycin resistance protein YoaR
MAENIEEKKLQPGRKRAAVILAVLAALLALSYLGLCAYADKTGRIMPNTSAAGVELGGLTRAQAAARLDAELGSRYEGQAVTFAYDGKDGRSSVTITSDSVAVDVDGVAADALSLGREDGFLMMGWGFLRGLAGGYQTDAPLGFPDEAAMDAVVSSVADAVDQSMVETTYTMTDAYLMLQKGEPGQALDREGLKARILSAFTNGEAHDTGSGSQADEITFFASPAYTFPAEPDLEGLYAKLYTEAKNAEFDPQTYEVTHEVVGVSFEIDAARELYEHTGWGSVCQVPLILTQPETTYESLNAMLFHDVLGTCTTSVGGTATRASNVALAASYCDGTIILPGGEFSYNGTVGMRTVERGFLPAPAYVNGETVDEIGGGICQMSSTIYLSALRGNMKILERQNHSYAVGYVPDGMDATVFYGSLDFRFENDTAYPIKLVASMNKRKLTVQIYGTKTDDITVKMESVRLETLPYSTVYRIDNSIAPGTSTISVTPYTGRKVEAYRCLYDGEGNLISRTLESVNNYRKRDQVILINSADAAVYGVDPVTGQPVPSAAVTPSPSTEPTVQPTAAPVQESAAPADGQAEPSEPASPEVTEIPDEASPSPTDETGTEG